MVTIKGKEYTKEELLELRSLIEKAVNSLDDTEAVEGTTLFPSWDDLVGKSVDIGFRCRYNGVLYKVIGAHTVQATWNPEDSPSLFAKVLIPDENVIPEWEQPSSTNGYMTGDVVTYDGVTYRSTIDNNVWKPTDYPQGWEIVEE